MSFQASRSLSPPPPPPPPPPSPDSSPSMDIKIIKTIPLDVMKKISPRIKEDDGGETIESEKTEGGYSTSESGTTGGNDVILLSASGPKTGRERREDNASEVIDVSGELFPPAASSTDERGRENGAGGTDEEGRGDYLLPSASCTDGLGGTHSSTGGEEEGDSTLDSVTEVGNDVVAPPTSGPKTGGKRREDNASEKDIDVPGELLSSAASSTDERERGNSAPENADSPGRDDVSDELLPSASCTDGLGGTRSSTGGEEEGDSTLKSGTDVVAPPTSGPGPKTGGKRREDNASEKDIDVPGELFLSAASFTDERERGNSAPENADSPGGDDVSDDLLPSASCTDGLGGTRSSIYIK